MAGWNKIQVERIVSEKPRPSEQGQASISGCLPCLARLHFRRALNPDVQTLGFLLCRNDSLIENLRCSCVPISPVSANKVSRTHINILDRIGRKLRIDVCFMLRSTRLAQ